MDNNDKGLRFDLSINLGQILTAASMVLSVMAAYFAIRSDIRDHESRLSRVEQSIINQDLINEKSVDTLSVIKTDIAVIRDRLERGLPRSIPLNEVPPR